MQPVVKRLMLANATVQTQILPLIDWFPPIYFNVFLIVRIWAGEKANALEAPLGLIKVRN